MTDGVASLKCVVAWSDRRNLCSIVGDALRAISPDEDVRKLGDDAHFVNSVLEPSEIRDQLKQHLTTDESVLVIEFEVWSSHGPGVDATWLLRRGH